jgi:hypothetical protein
MNLPGAFPSRARAASLGSGRGSETNPERRRRGCFARVAGREQADETGIGRHMTAATLDPRVAILPQQRAEHGPGEVHEAV